MKKLKSKLKNGKDREKEQQLFLDSKCMEVNHF